MTSTAVATSAPKPKGFAALMSRFAPQMEAVLPRHLTAERMIALLNLVAIKTPALKECAESEAGMLSLFGAIMNASRLGLEIGSHAHLLPFKNNKLGIMECVMVPDYRGLAELARRANPGVIFDATCVFAGDEFEYELGLTPKLVHRPARASIERQWSTLRAAYAIARFPDGSTKFEVLEQWEIAKIRASSRAKDSGPWVQWFDRMAMKSALKRLTNLMPQTPELTAAIELDNRAESGEVGKLLPDFDTPEQVNADVRDKTAAKGDELRERLEAQRKRQTPPEGVSVEGITEHDGGTNPPAEDAEMLADEARQSAAERRQLIDSFDGFTQAQLHKAVTTAGRKAGIPNINVLNPIVKRVLGFDSYQEIKTAEEAADLILVLEQETKTE